MYQNRNTLDAHVLSSSFHTYALSIIGVCLQNSLFLIWLVAFVTFASP